ncbi:hypothetical protein [Dactylosporangium matsuzakiense]|uniref:Uncharacterized protein n=1 Tax=Dactylosporangium matsuzakiense TaxID=53360 RepID=A0A9W6NSZ9_9ACTN|nr:hypothetical protein [Dactylosporangium matsuzakiense]GLL07993.1 hypothetical protein GCM10017581_097530 [Dactylosporangium matsuzakiense]
MDGHWEWSEGGGDDADTADLTGDAGHDLHGGFEAEGFEAHGDYSTDFGGDEHGPGGHLDSGHAGDDLEEPLGTEHATAEYDESLHGHDDLGGHEDTGGSGGDGHGGDGEHDVQLDDRHLDPGHDGTGSHDTGSHDTGDPGRPDHDGGAEHHEAAFGADPDVDASADDPAWHDVQFPDELHLQDPPAPVDGFPWTDADVLGGPDHSLSAAFDPAVEPGTAEPGGLADYEHLDVPPGTDPWSLLLGSEDPATSSLATYWAPQ